MRKRLLGALGVVAILATACGPSAASPSASSPVTSGPPASTPAESPSAAPFDPQSLFTTAYAPEEGTDGGQIIMGDWQEANQFNPFYVGQVTEANVASATWASLMVLTHDFKYAPDLAAEIPTLANGGVKAPGDGGDAMTVTWKLRDGLKWSDGQPLTCDDFIYTQDWVMDPENVGVVTSGFDVSTVECTDPTTLVIHYKEIFEGYISQWSAPLPKHFLSKLKVADMVKGAGFRAEEVKDLPVSGAFKFDTVTAGQEIRLVKNPNYTSWKTGKPAHLDTLIFKWYGDTQGLIAGFRAGDVDFATDLAESDVPAVQDLGDQLSAIPALLYEFLRPNWADGTKVGEDGVGDCSRNPVVQDRGDGCPMADAAMREAVAYAVDKERINVQIMSGNAEVANGSITPSAWFYSAQPAKSYDPEKAKQVLEDGGWKDTDGDGIREKNGLKAKIELCTTTLQRRQDTLALLAAWLKDVGIEAIPNPTSSTDVFADYNESTKDTVCALSHSNFDLAEHAFSSSIDPLGGYFNYHSSQFEPKGANDAQVSDPALDKAYDTVKGSVDFAVLKDAMADVQQVFYDKTVEIPLYYRKAVELHAPRLGNFFANGTQAGPTWNVVDWYVKG
jgi:peptide/nickel transport system substrate-binding protein